MVDQERGDYREHMDHYRVSYSDYTMGVFGVGDVEVCSIIMCSVVITVDAALMVSGVG